MSEIDSKPIPSLADATDSCGLEAALPAPKKAPVRRAKVVVPPVVEAPPVVVLPPATAEQLAAANAELGEHKVLVPAEAVVPSAVEDAEFVRKLKKSYKKVSRERDDLKKELDELKATLKEKADKEEALRLKRNEASRKAKAKAAEKKKAAGGAGADVIARLEAVEKKVGIKDEAKKDEDESEDEASVASSSSSSSSDSDSDDE